MAVRGKEAFRRKFARLKSDLVKELSEAMEKSAVELVREMKAIAPNAEIRNSIKWTWGDAPKGSTVLATSSGGRGYETLRITVYTDRDIAWFAHLFEFGTRQRFRKKVGGKYASANPKSTSTGTLTAQPFFFPSYRANRRRIKGRINRALRKVVKRYSDA